MDLTAGVSSNFLQELVMLDLSDQTTKPPSSPSASPTIPQEKPEQSQEVKVKQEDDMAIDVEDDGQIHDVDDNNDNEEQGSCKGTFSKVGEVDGKLIATPIIL